MANKNDTIARLLLGSKKSEREHDDDAALIFESVLASMTERRASNFTLVSVAGLLLNEAHKRTLLEPSELVAVCEAVIAPSEPDDG